MTGRLLLHIMIVMICAFLTNDAFGQAKPELRYFPSPDRVHEDIRRQAGNADELTISARAAGRFLMLATTVENLQVQRFERAKWPASARRLYDVYVHEHHKTRKLVEPSLESNCMSSRPCRRAIFFETRGHYERDEAVAREVARLYFPPAQQAEFVELSGGPLRRSEERANRAAWRAATERQRERELVKQREKEQADRRVLLGGALCFGLPTIVIVLIYWKIVRSRKEFEANRTDAVSNTVERFISQFDSPGLTRVEAINRAIDEKLRPLDFHLHWMRSTPYLSARCHISRSLTSMSTREREALRAVLILRHENLHVSEHNTWIQILGIVFGDGKATIFDDATFSGFDQIDGDFSSRKKKVSYIVGDDGVESSVNLALRELASAVKNSPGNSAVQVLASRLFANGGDLSVPSFLERFDNGKIPGDALVLGTDHASKNICGVRGEGALVTIAPPGSGKTQCHVLPNLLNWTGAAIVLDVKGEIFSSTSGWRASNVGPIYKFSPLSPDQSHCYNPLAEISRDPDYLWEDCRFLADMLIVPIGKDPFWENRARDVLTAAIAHVVHSLPGKERNMNSVLDILHGRSWDKFMVSLESSKVPSLSRMGSSLAAMDSKMRDSVLQAALASLSAWEGSRISRSTMTSDWSPMDFRDSNSPRTLYICVNPNEIDSYASVLRVVIAQHIRQLTAKLPENNARTVLFLLDELPRLKYMAPVEEALEIGRQYGIKLWLFAQSLGQLQTAYENAEGMIGSCSIRMFMNPSLHDGTAQKLSDELGYRESVIDGSRIKRVEANVIAGGEFKNKVVVMAGSAEPGAVEKYFAYSDSVLSSRMEIPTAEPF